MNTLRDYQTNIISTAARLIGIEKKRSVMIQLDTGGGKTIIFSTISHRFVLKTKQRVAIFVHRDLLMRQTAATLKKWYGIDAEIIDASTKFVRDAQVYVIMCETIFRRLAKNPKYLPPIGLCIYDEAHLGNFKKIYPLFPDAIRLGFTATPVSTDSKTPLRNYYEDIVAGPGIKHLISIGSLLQNHTYCIKGIKRGELLVNRGEFDERQMGDVFSKLKHVNNVVAAYKKYGIGKAIVFNCNVSHSKLVNKAFCDAGYKSRHVDGKTPEWERRATFDWFHSTEGAILNNYGIATMGFDEPTVQTVINNYATMSLVKWLQTTGRGARPSFGQNHFVNIDMGDNARTHLDWNEERDWADVFWNTRKKTCKLGVAPLKDCPKCDALIPATVKICPYCEYVLPEPVPEYDKEEVIMEMFTKIDVGDLVKQSNESGYKPYYSFYRIGFAIATRVKYKYGKHFTIKVAEEALKVYESKAEEWCKIKGVTWNGYHKSLVKKHLYDLFRKNHNFIEPIGMVAMSENLIPSI